jgi:hypothetical protein
MASLVLLAGLFCSCEKVIEFEGEALDSKLVMYSILERDSLISVHLSYSYPVFEPEFSYSQLTGAAVSLFRDGSFVESLTYRSPAPSGYEFDPAPAFSAYGSASEVPVPGSTYRIEASVPGYPDVSSEAIVPEAVPVMGLDTVTVVRADYDWSYLSWKVTLRFSDPPDEENYYRLVVSQVYGFYTGDRFLPYSNEFPVVVAEIGDIWVESDDPILSPGEDNSIFGSGTPNTFSVFSDELVSGKQYGLDFYLEPFLYMEYDTAYHDFMMYTIRLQSITKDLYLYLMTRSAQDVFGDDPFSEPVIVHSNIDGGLGIFAASASSSRSIMMGTYPVEGVYYLTEEEFYKNWDY